MTNVYFLIGLISSMIILFLGLQQHTMAWTAEQKSKIMNATSENDLTPELMSMAEQIVSNRMTGLDARSQEFKDFLACGMEGGIPRWGFEILQCMVNEKGYSIKLLRND